MPFRCRESWRLNNFFRIEAEFLQFVYPRFQKAPQRISSALKSVVTKIWVFVTYTGDKNQTFDWVPVRLFRTPQGVPFIVILSAAKNH